MFGVTTLVAWCLLLFIGFSTAMDSSPDNLTEEQKRQVLDFFTHYFKKKSYKGCKPVYGFTFCSDIDIEVDSRIIFK